MSDATWDVVVIGCGIAGIATAYYLKNNHGVSKIALIDCGAPMAYTSAQSGENYRNWWPHPSMVALTNRSIDLMESLATSGDNRINMTRRGYVLATRRTNLDAHIDELYTGYGADADRLLRFHDEGGTTTYDPASDGSWQSAPDGVDIVTNRSVIRQHFPTLDEEVRALIHIRRGGHISGHQLGMQMLESLTEAGAKRVLGTVTAIDKGARYDVHIDGDGGSTQLSADIVINAAGPCAGAVANMLEVELPVYNSFQQKIAFADTAGVVPRALPFAIDLDRQRLDWHKDEHDALVADPKYRWLTETMPGSIHCRPDGGDGSTFIKLGWAYNARRALPTWEMPLDESFPEIVLRGAARLQPALRVYYERLPRSLHHYGGWYTMTEENWPLVGPMGPTNAHTVSALSGFGTMAACAVGELCAAWATGAELSHYAWDFSLARYNDAVLMQSLQDSGKGIL